MSEASERLDRFCSTEASKAGERKTAGQRLAELDELGQQAHDTVDRDVPVLSTLGNETRYRIVHALVNADRDLAVCEIHPIVSVGESAVSHALAELRDVGLVDRYRDGKWRYYEPTELAESLMAALEARE